MKLSGVLVVSGTGTWTVCVPTAINAKHAVDVGRINEQTKHNAFAGLQENNSGGISDDVPADSGQVNYAFTT